MLYESLRERLQELATLDRPELHRPSAIEEPFMAFRDDVFDVQQLPGFRRRTSPLAGGTMNWPNRAEPPGNRARRAWSEMRGRRWLRAEDRAVRRDLPPHLASVDLDNLVGQPFHATRRGRVVSEPGVRAGHYLEVIARHVPIEAGATILEVGPGYGGLARLLNKHLGARVILVDLPERLALQAYFLTESGRTVALVEGSEVADFTLVAPWQLPDVDTSVHLAVNTHSMQEMTGAQVDFYVSQIERLGGWFFSSNRMSKPVGDERDRTEPQPTGWEVVLDRPQPGYPEHRERLYRRS